VAAAQNGLDQDSRLAAFAPSEWVVPALTYIAAERLEPGRVVHLGGDRVVVPAGESEKLLSQTTAGLAVRGAQDMRTASWRKLLGNLVANPITALTLRRIGVMEEPGIEELARGLLLEAVQVGRAEGARLGDQDVAAVLAGTGQYGNRTGSSMLYDRLAGRPLEHQYLTGEVVRRAETHGIPVPLNAAILALLDALDQGGSKP
jgi:2-dehydropantoate 2-reductase